MHIIAPSAHLYWVGAFVVFNRKTTAEKISAAVIFHPKKHYKTVLGSGGC